MLFFDDDEATPLVPDGAVKCSCCRDRTATWMASLIDGTMASVCAHCLMYRDDSAWGVENRSEILHVGRRCAEEAERHRKMIPKLDPRGRLSPGDAERFIVGVAFSTRMLRKMGVR